MDAAPDYSIVLPAYNEAALLAEAVTTSGRKARWCPAPVLLAVMVGFVVCPWLVLSRHYCWLWYRRPTHT